MLSIAKHQSRRPINDEGEMGMGMVVVDGKRQSEVGVMKWVMEGGTHDQHLGIWSCDLLVLMNSALPSRFQRSRMGRTRPHHTLILLHGESSKRPRNFGTAHADGVYLLSGGEEAVLVVVWQLETGHPTKVRVRE
ncbi:hypothetical protein BC938DRAFT_470542 [Jimgerdemannia flammicorona]|uniref:Uncharacterized protein n=1 Tax=Jimgerdemannia flammicorona TaxID=994334 RepID=A0A433QA01_9FUNG|nr:hypothetical protein BC938DRAFT_470542 [Jimgerdemannia flammicorona]